MPLAAFSEVRIMTWMRLGTTFGPSTATDITGAASGYDGRQVLWPTHPYRGELHYEARHIADLQQLDAFFRCQRGKAIGFRVKDHKDYTATMEALVVGDGLRTVVQLGKGYSSGAASDTYYRAITKPVGIDRPLGNTYDSVQLYQNGVLMDAGYGIDYTTGVVTLALPLASGVVLSWSGEFDVPMRFDIDYLPLSLHSFGVGQSHQPIPVVELMAWPSWPGALVA